MVIEPNLDMDHVFSVAIANPEKMLLHSVQLDSNTLTAMVPLLFSPDRRRCDALFDYNIFACSRVPQRLNYNGNSTIQNMHIYLKAQDL